MNRHRFYDVIVLGGGAAGLMAAATAGKRGRRVLLLERSNKIGKKILMSGGGRCNFTNLEISANNFICSNPHFVKSALSQYSQWDFIALVSFRYLVGTKSLGLLVARCRRGHGRRRIRAVARRDANRDRNRTSQCK